MSGKVHSDVTTRAFVLITTVHHKIINKANKNALFVSLVVDKGAYARHIYFSSLNTWPPELSLLMHIVLFCLCAYSPSARMSFLQVHQVLLHILCKVI